MPYKKIAYVCINKLKFLHEMEASDVVVEIFGCYMQFFFIFSYKCLPNTQLWFDIRIVVKSFADSLMDLGNNNLG